MASRKPWLIVTTKDWVYVMDYDEKAAAEASCDDRNTRATDMGTDTRYEVIPTSEHRLAR
jgi:hypothetical protein